MFPRLSGSGCAGSAVRAVPIHVFTTEIGISAPRPNLLWNRSEARWAIPYAVIGGPTRVHGSRVETDVGSTGQW